MPSVTKKLAVVAGAAAATVVLALASAAFACTNLAALNLSSSSGQAGTQVTVTGSAFARAPKNTPVALHWNGLDGPVLATVTPDAAGAINATTITIPSDAKPGFYTIVATQTEIATGLTPWGLPTRAGFQVEGPGATPAQPVQAVSAGSADSGVSGGFLPPPPAPGLGRLAPLGLGPAPFLSTYPPPAPPPRPLPHPHHP